MKILLLYENILLSKMQLSQNSHNIKIILLKQILNCHDIIFHKSNNSMVLLENSKLHNVTDISEQSRASHIMRLTEELTTGVKRVIRQGFAYIISPPIVRLIGMGKFNIRSGSPRL